MEEHPSYEKLWQSRFTAFINTYDSHNIAQTCKDDENHDFYCNFSSKLSFQWTDFAKKIFSTDFLVMSKKVDSMTLKLNLPKSQFPYFQNTNFYKRFITKGIANLSH